MTKRKKTQLGHYVSPEAREALRQIRAKEQRRRPFEHVTESATLEAIIWGVTQQHEIIEAGRKVWQEQVAQLEG
jgi:hypothetical protein